MRKIHLLGLALLAVFAFSAATAGSASAVVEWLANANPFTGELAVDTEGSVILFLILSGTGGILNEIECSAASAGDVTGGTAGTDLTLEVLSLTGVLIGELGGQSLSCTVTFSAKETGDCEVGLEFLLFTDELSTWESKLELMATAPELLDKLFAKYETLCLDSSGFNIESLCSGETSAELKNVAGGVEVKVSPAAPISSEEIECTTGIIKFLSGYEATDLLLLTNGETLSAD